MTFAELPDFGSLIISPRTEGTICHDTPNLSLSQPQGCCSPPSESCSHNRSISSCVSQLTKREVPCANVKYGRRPWPLTALRRGRKSRSAPSPSPSELPPPPPPAPGSWSSLRSRHRPSRPPPPD